MSRPQSRVSLATLVAGGLLAGGVVVGGALSASGALAASPSPSPSASSSPSTGPGGRTGDRHGMGPMGGMGGPGMRGLGGLGAGRALHGEVTVEKADGSGTEVRVVQAGTITGVSGDVVTVRSTDGYVLSWTLDSSTKVRTGWQSGSVKDLAQGDTVVLSGTKSSSGAVATLVAERPAASTRRSAPNPSGIAGTGSGTQNGGFDGPGTDVGALLGI